MRERQAGNPNSRYFVPALPKMLIEMKGRDDVSLLTILKHYEPRFQNGYQIQLRVANGVQAELMNSARIELLNFLSKELQTNGIELVIDVDATLYRERKGAAFERAESRL